MVGYRKIILALLACFLILFLLVEALNVPLLTDPAPWLEAGGGAAALLGISLLVVDVVLPVPSSLVMIAHGVHFGVLVGTLLSVVGSLGAALLGFAIGRRGGQLLKRLVPLDERAQADQLLRRWVHSRSSSAAGCHCSPKPSC